MLDYLSIKIWKWETKNKTFRKTVLFGLRQLLDFSDRMSPLGNASAEECANYCITLFSDLTKKVTMQNLYHDGGFSSMGMSFRAMGQYEKGPDTGWGWQKTEKKHDKQFFFPEGVKERQEIPKKYQNLLLWLIP